MANRHSPQGRSRTASEGRRSCGQTGRYSGRPGDAGTAGRHRALPEPWIDTGYWSIWRRPAGKLPKLSGILPTSARSSRKRNVTITTRVGRSNCWTNSSKPTRCTSMNATGWKKNSSKLRNRRRSYGCPTIESTQPSRYAIVRFSLAPPTRFSLIMPHHSNARSCLAIVRHMRLVWIQILSAIGAPQEANINLRRKAERCDGSSQRPMRVAVPPGSGASHIAPAAS
jgi:hypothetical protein